MTDEGSGRSPYLTDDGTLINADRARIDPGKFTEYALDPDHPVGGDKAYVFERVLGFNRTNWQALRDQILDGILTTPASAHGAGRYGPLFTVEVRVRGPRGTQAVVRTGWIYDDEDLTPRLTTLFIP